MPQEQTTERTTLIPETPTPDEQPRQDYRFLHDDVIDKDTLWSEMLVRLNKNIGQARMESTFSRVVPLGITEDGEFVVGVTNSFVYSLIARMHQSELSELATEISGLPVTVEVVLDPNLTALIEAKTEADAVDAVVQEESIPETVEDNQFDQKFTFDSFVTGESNDLAYSAALAVAESPGLKYNPLFLWGGPGLGKTHLLHSIGAYIAECYPHKRIIYTTLEAMLNQYVKAMMSKKKVDIEWLRETYRSTDVLIVDDIQFIEGKQGMTDFFFHTLNTLVDQHKQVVIASDRSPDRLDLDNRLVSRFKMGMMADIQTPSYEVKLAILQQYTQKMDATFDDESLSYIAEKSSGNIREMEGICNRVTAWAGLRHAANINLDLVLAATSECFTEEQKRPISIETIMKETCRYYHLTRDELIGTKRKQDIIHARHIAMFLCQEMTDSSYPAIGRAFGGKDHTTVLHAVKKISKKMGEDRDVFNQIKQLTDYVNKRAI